MKKIAVTVLLLLVIIPSFVQAEKLIVKVENIGPEKGEINIGIYEQGGDFPEPGKEIRGAKVEVKSDSLTRKFQDIPPGSYAVSLFHDENENDKLDKNFLGIPQEGYGFSNNVFNWYGAAPEFDKAMVTLKPEKSLTVTIKVKGWPPQL